MCPNQETHPFNLSNPGPWPGARDGTRWAPTASYFSGRLRRDHRAASTDGGHHIRFLGPRTYGRLTSAAVVCLLQVGGHEAMPWIRQHWAAHTRQRCKLGARTQQSGAGHVLFVILVLAPHALCFLRHSISIGYECRGVTGNVATTVAPRPKAEASKAREGENGRGPMRCATTVTRRRCFVHDRFT